MKLPKRMLAYLIITQIILICAHLVLYTAAIFFFPNFFSHHTALLTLLLILSVSFNLAFGLNFQQRGKIFRWFYIIVACWQPMWTYLLLAFAVSSLIYLINPNWPIDQIVSVLVIYAIILNIYGILNARHIRVIRLTIKLPHLPEFWQNKTAVLVSDLHLGHILREETAKKIVNKINSENPDIIFIPGDVFDGPHPGLAGLVEPLKNLKSNYGSYFCSGNHEFYAGMEECEQSLINVGVNILDDKKIEIEGLQLLGLAYHGGQTDQQAGQILSRLQIDSSKPSVLLKHIPTAIGVAAGHGISLQLSGHTHKAQVWPLNFIAKKIFKGFDYGLKRFGKMQVYTSSGVGTWGPPVRIFTKAEIIKIKFIKDQ